ncbi:MAG: sec-independent protein translocase protein TatA [Chthoniobacter sp.]|nr:sec-independent protein translocase protein TatA [Chthoniobacter sp.]
MITLASLFNLAGPDLLVILLIVLLLFGAKKLPELARGMGQAMREFNKAKDEFEHEITRPSNEVKAQPAPNKLEHKPAEPVVAAPAPVQETQLPS